MRVAYFDCFSGISGDMTLGALVDAGADGDELARIVGGLGLTGIRVKFRRTVRGYLAGTRAEVTAEAEPAHRHLPTIRKILGEAPLPDRVRERALAVFDCLAAAEAAVHGTTKDQVHFHEVGALDAIADIVGSAAGLELLGVERVIHSEVALGSGTVTCRHGAVPVPGPATTHLLKDRPVRFTGREGELTTPTGAAILAALGLPLAKGPSFTVKSVGYGFGAREGGDLPNALRVVVGEAANGALEELVLLETNLDDVTGETVGHLIERCLESGALDAFAAPVQMKKSRPGLVFSALCSVEAMDALTDLIHEETGTLGVRGQRVFRSAVARDVVTRTTPFGEVRFKRAVLPSGAVTWSPEMDDASRIAREQGIALREVLARLARGGAGDDAEEGD